MIPNPSFRTASNLLTAPRVAAPAVLSLFLVAASSASGRPAAQLDLTVVPPVVQLGHAPIVAVTGHATGSVEVRLSGASDVHGRASRWTSLRRIGNRWSGRVAPPAMRGIYPIEVRTTSAGVVRSTRWFVRIYARRTAVRPSFTTPLAAARAWVRAAKHARIVAARHWPLPAADHRLPQLHRLFVVAYRHRGATLGTFIMVVRDGFDGRWRVLETALLPPVLALREVAPAPPGSA